LTGSPSQPAGTFCLLNRIFRTQRNPNRWPLLNRPISSRSGSQPASGQFTTRFPVSPPVPGLAAAHRALEQIGGSDEIRHDRLCGNS